MFFFILEYHSLKLSILLYHKHVSNFLYFFLSHYTIDKVNQHSYIFLVSDIYHQLFQKYHIIYSKIEATLRSKLYYAGYCTVKFPRVCLFPMRKLDLDVIIAKIYILYEAHTHHGFSFPLILFLVVVDDVGH